MDKTIKICSPKQILNGPHPSLIAEVHRFCQWAKRRSRVSTICVGFIADVHWPCRDVSSRPSHAAGPAQHFRQLQSAYVTHVLRFPRTEQLKSTKRSLEIIFQNLYNNLVQSRSCSYPKSRDRWSRAEDTLHAFDDEFCFVTANRSCRVNGVVP